MKILRPDMQERFRSERRNDIYDYLYECNALNPTGETAFMSMCLPYGWAKRPMIRRWGIMDFSFSIILSFHFTTCHIGVQKTSF